MGDSILRHWGSPWQLSIFFDMSKGNEVNIPQAQVGLYGNINLLKDASVSPWKSCLFFLTV